MHTRNSCSSLKVFTLLAMVLFSLWAWPVNGLAVDGQLTGGTVKAQLDGRPSPSLPNEFCRAYVSAQYTNPTRTAECGMITGPTWAWTIRSVERQNPMTGTWVPDPYRPTIKHPRRSSTAVTAFFPSGGVWRVTLDVQAEWTSQDCGPCEDTDSLVVDFPEVSDCSFVGKMSFDDDFIGRSRTSVGLMEKGTLSVRLAEGTVLADVAPLTWGLRSGGDSIGEWQDTGNGTGSFQASYNAGKAVFELTSGKTGGVSTVTLDIVAPSGVVHTFESFRPGNGVNAGIVKFQIWNTVHILPDNVSFSGIKCGEGEDPVADMKGELKSAAVIRLGEKAPHEQNGPFDVTSPTLLSGGSCWATPDQIGPGGIHENGEAGHFIWEIPQQWFGAFMTRNDFAVLTQRHDFDGQRTIRIQKGGVDKSGP